MTREKAKKELLMSLATILQKDDDLFPDVSDDSNEYPAWDKARSELIDEFRRRSK